jgi:hypothetical protein
VFESPTIVTARANGHWLGRRNIHTHAVDYRTSAEWAAWLEGHRSGYAEYRAEQHAIMLGLFGQVPEITPAKPPSIQQRRQLYLERKSA